MGIYRDGRVDIIPNDQGNRITPSYVAWDEAGRLLGDAAKNQATVNPSNVRVLLSLPRPCIELT